MTRALAMAAVLTLSLTACAGPPHELTDYAGMGWNCLTTPSTYCVRPPGCPGGNTCTHEVTAWCYYTIAPVYGGYNCHALRSTCEAGRAEALPGERVSTCEEYR